MLRPPRSKTLSRSPVPGSVIKTRATIASPAPMATHERNGNDPEQRRAEHPAPLGFADELYGQHQNVDIQSLWTYPPYVRWIRDKH